MYYHLIVIFAAIIYYKSDKKNIYIGGKLNETNQM